MKTLCFLVCMLGLIGFRSVSLGADLLALEKIPEASQKNVVLILVDDLRFDAMGFMDHPFLKTPNLDRLAREGTHFSAAYVTTSLCSPSRASILTGQYAHTHKVINNQDPYVPGTVFFPQYLQGTGYETAFFGKWHMGGHSDAPQPGFDHWVSFKGQGTYRPSRDGLNIDGKHTPQQGYMTDELNQKCADWIKSRNGDKPFFAYLSHKAVHGQFDPADRHKGIYEDKEWTPPTAIYLENPNDFKKPRWVRDQRNSWHGVDFPYHSNADQVTLYKRFCETLLAVDEGVGQLIETLEKKGILDETLILFMGDNGYCFGENGLIDKRTAYESSIRVPLLARCPSLFKGGQVCDRVVANIDIAPSILAAAGLKAPGNFQGMNFPPLLTNSEAPWRENLLYEYYWEREFPQTPTMHALRTPDFKFIRYHGIWDTDELYDMRADPLELNNLINEKEHLETARTMRRRLFEELKKTDGLNMPFYADHGPESYNLRSSQAKPAADFPKWFYK
jgi:N-acetylglucosamine-6-sulfatase